MAKLNFKLFSFLIILLLVSCQPENKPNNKDDGMKFEFYNLKNINKPAIKQSLDLAGQWLLNNQDKNGSIKYRYFPDKDEYFSGNNMIRQFMATTALSEMYEYTDNLKYKESFEKNLGYNINNYYYETDDLGYIYYNGNAKLGAAAFAYEALSRSENNSFSDKKQKLENFIFFMHNKATGKFKTFYLPPEADRNHNFYPGETMLAFMLEYEKTKDEKYLDLVKRSFDYYLEFFRNNPNPAFVPWHTMADYWLYKSTKEKKYADFIFEMNDFLTQIQHKSCTPDKRFLGRFYDPLKSEYGPAHASSTGIYVEGLTYAYRIAKELNDTQRAEKYKEAVLLGVRSLMQLQYKEGDEKVLGGIRKTVENNELRVDNMQHSIMAFIQVLNSFTDEEIADFAKHNSQFNC